MALVSEVKKVIAGLKGLHALAILVPTNINGAGEDFHVLVEDPSSRWQSRRRFVFQIGTVLVIYTDGKSKKTFNPDSVKVVLSV